MEATVELPGDLLIFDEVEGFEVIPVEWGLADWNTPEEFEPLLLILLRSAMLQGAIGGIERCGTVEVGRQGERRRCYSVIEKAPACHGQPMLAHNERIGGHLRHPHLYPSPLMGCLLKSSALSIFIEMKALLKNILLILSPPHYTLPQADTLLKSS